MDNIVFSKKDPLRAKGVDYLNVADEKLFPALFSDHSESERSNSSLREDYNHEVFKSVENYFSKECCGNQTFAGVEESLHFETRQSVNSYNLWDHMSQWLSERLREGVVDSVPSEVTHLFTQKFTTKIATLNEDGRQKLEENQARRAAAKAEMDNYIQEIDDRERRFNVFTSGEIYTHDQMRVAGKMDEDFYSTLKIIRDEKESKAKREIDERYATEELDEGDYDVDVITEENEVYLSYFYELGNCLHDVEHDHSLSKREKNFSSYLYRLLWPIYAVGHPRSFGKIFKELWNESKKFFAGVIVFILILVIGWLFKLEDIPFILFVTIPGFLVFVFTALNSIAFFMYLPDFFKNLFNWITKDSAYKAEAKRNAPEVYRQLRYYKLWNGKHPSVKKMQEIFDSYLMFK